LITKNPIYLLFSNSLTLDQIHIHIGIRTYIQNL